MLEGDRERREVEREEKDDYSDLAEGKERYMFVSTMDLALVLVDKDDDQRRNVVNSQVDAEIDFQEALLNDAMMDACFVGDDSDLDFDIDAIATGADALEALAIQETMATIPTPPSPSRRTSRRGTTAPV